MGEMLRKALILLIVFYAIFPAIGYAGNGLVTPYVGGETERQTATETQNVTEKSAIKEYTLEELAEYNGKNGKVYVAYQGQVYDVSSSNPWKEGMHAGCNAGTDLTGKLDKTPHGAEILKGYPIVGSLKK